MGNPKFTNEDIDKRASKLIEEVDEHIAEVKLKNPKAKDRKIYEAWVIQKLASIQLAIEELFT